MLPRMDLQQLSETACDTHIAHLSEGNNVHSFENSWNNWKPPGPEEVQGKWTVMLLEFSNGLIKVREVEGWFIWWDE